jgi:hypothetical protein
MRSKSVWVVVAALAALGVQQSLGAQSYSRGQNVSPAYEGWERAEDGTVSFLFGYMNRNWEEELDVPVGADNNIQPGGPDVGQPTHFLPRRNRFVFKVKVPAGFTVKDEMVWTLTTHGKTEKAYATLREDYFVDNVVIASETGSLGAGTSSPETRANKTPIITLEGEATRTVRVGQPLSLAVVVKDDNVPRSRAAQAAGVPRGRGMFNPPTRITVGKVNGLHAGWFVYRGAGKVKFDPPQVKVWEDTRAGANSPWAPLWTPEPMPPDGRLASTVVFEQPGTYVLTCRADDGALYADTTVTVTVTQ